MTWTETNQLNQSKCGMVKYTIKTPLFDGIEEIYDFPHLQHDIKSLYAINGKFHYFINFLPFTTSKSI